MGSQRTFASMAGQAKGEVTGRERFLAEMDAVLPWPRDPEMKQTRKGKNWHFGMKLHIGADPRGIVHTVTATDAAAADISQLPDLLHGQERAVFGDQAYWKEADCQAFAARGVRYRINRRPTPGAPLSERWRMINRARSRTRACGEHAFRVVKQLWGFVKVRYRAWPRTWRGPRPCLPWPISTKSAMRCSR